MFDTRRKRQWALSAGCWVPNTDGRRGTHDCTRTVPLLDADEARREDGQYFMTIYSSILTSCNFGNTQYLIQHISKPCQ